MFFQSQQTPLEAIEWISKKHLLLSVHVQSTQGQDISHLLQSFAALFPSKIDLLVQGKPFLAEPDRMPGILPCAAPQEPESLKGMVRLQPVDQGLEILLYLLA